jgi:hypothetical protein
MSPGAKLFLTLAAAAGALGTIAVFSAKKANASPKEPEQLPAGTPPDVIVPPLGSDDSAPPASLPPLSLPTQVQVPTPQGPVTVPLPPIVPAPTVVPVPNIVTAPAPSAPTSQQPPAQSVPASPPAVTVPLPTGPITVPLPPIVTQPSQTPAPTAAPAPVTTIPADLAAMVSALLQAEQSAGWNIKDPAVQVFQKSRGLKVDGMYGPKTALTVAASMGTIPIIRFWPKGSQKAKTLSDYRAALITLANETPDQNRAAQLRFAAQREQAQSFGVKEGKAPPIPLSAQVSLARVA